MKHVYTYILFSIAIILSSSQGYSQEKTEPIGNATISGVAIDEGLREPIPYVTVALKSIESGEIVGGQITDDKGRFTLKNVNEGILLLEFQFIGYQTLSQEVTISDMNQRLNLGNIYLSEDVTVLAGVEVVAERSTIEQRVDRKIINVGKDLSTTGATAADLMVNIPSVNVDRDGSISLRGNDNVRILVDGKPTNLSASQLLQQIPSTSIKKIELITNPSAKFIPDGMSGIINIVLHKNTNLGLNGNISIGNTMGLEYRFAGSGDVSYKTQKLNLFVNYGNNHGLDPTRGEISRPRDPSNEIWRFVDNRNSHLFKTGLDYFVSDRTTLSAYTIQNQFSNEAYRFTAIAFPENETSDIFQQYDSEVNNQTATYNFDVQHQFNEEGQQLELEVDYSEFKGDDIAAFIFWNTDAVTNIAIEDITMNRQNTIINLDYTSPMANDKKLELGAEARVQKIDNEYLTTNPGLNNSQFSFDRTIYSGYVNYTHKMEKWSYQLGARLEGFETVGLLEESRESNQRFNNNVLTVYPSASLSFIPDPEKQINTFNLSISRRVDRPNLNQVNPIRVWSSPRITNIGNPALVPQFTNSVEVNYTRQLKAGSITTGVFLRKISDEITRFGFNDSENPANILYSYNNYDDNLASGFEISGNYKISPKWSFNTSFDIYAQNQQGVIQDEYREVQNVLYNFRMNHSYKVSKKLTFQLVSLYRGPNTNLQYKRLAFYFVNFGGRYSVLDGNGTLSINFNDIFKTQQNSFDGERPVRIEGVFDWDSRTLFIGYSHRFGTGKNQSLKRKKRDSNEAKSGGF